MDQKHEIPFDESKNDINPKIGSGFKGKRQKGNKFYQKIHGIGAPKYITTNRNGLQKDKYVAARSKNKSK